MAMITQNRDVAGFNRIDLRGYGDITLTQGEEERLSITADEQLMPRLISEVRGGTLYLDQDRSWLEWLTLPHSPIHYDIGVKSLNRVSISGSGSLSAAKLEGDSVEISISGSAKIAIDDLLVKAIDVSVSGSGELKLAGRADRQQIRTSGSATIHAIELAGQQVEIRISGSGEAWLNGESSLNVDVSGSGRVYYRGNPRLNQRISGSGRIEQVQ